LDSISNHLAKIKRQIRTDEILFSREPHSVFLLAVSKGQPIDKISAAINAGQLAFGESRVQEALLKIAFFHEKMPEKNIEWHFIGIIQRNKTKKIAEHFNWAHSVTNTDIAKRLNEQRPLHLPPLNICLQVNTSERINKTGVAMTDVEALADYCASLSRLKLRGLMTIPVPKNIFDEQRQEFHELNRLFKKLNAKYLQLDTLSMGMSHDLTAAIAEGATLVRAGTAIFDARILNPLL
jgi:pyridoxal phosphate enzyme (YggS family)